MRSRCPWLLLVRLLTTGRREAMRPDLQLALLRLDEQNRRRLRERCGGHWDRVTVGEDGAFTVHDRPQAHTYPHLPSAPTPRPTRQRVLQNQAQPQAQAAGLKRLQSQSLVAGLRALAALMHLVRAVARWLWSEFLVMWRDVLALLDRDPPAGAEPFDWRAVDLHRVAPRVPGLWRDSLLAARGFVYRDETWTHFGVDVEVVAATLARPERVEMHPLSFSPMARHAVISFHRTDITVVLGFRDPAYPEVVAALVGSLPQSDGTRTDGQRDDQVGDQNAPTSHAELRARLTALGAAIETDEYGLLAKVTYKGQDAGVVNAGDNVPLAVVHTDWWRTRWCIQAIDQRGREY